jgi:hypothetical protein
MIVLTFTVKRLTRFMIFFLIFIFFLAPLSTAQTSDKKTTGQKVLIYSENTLSIIDPNGSNIKELLVRPDVLDFVSLNDGKIFIHSKQYEGEALEILDPSTGVSGLIEYSEGKFPNIDVSDDGSIVAYEVRHFPISGEGDGVWLYVTNGKKTHVKISGSMLSIESLVLYEKYLYMLYHEIDLVSDEAGLFLEKMPLDGKGKPERERVPEGLKMLLADGYTLGFTYPASGRRIELRHLTNQSFQKNIEVRSGDIIFEKNYFAYLKTPVLCFKSAIPNELGELEYTYNLWYAESSEILPLKPPGITDLADFNWSVDGWLYFSACQVDLSNQKSQRMLFRLEPRKNILELVSVHGGQVAFMH